MEKAEARLSEWFNEQGYSPRWERHAEQVVAFTPPIQAEIDMTLYRVDRRPNRPQYWEKRATPGPEGFRIELHYAEERNYLPQILTQYITARGPECQRFLHRDREGKVVSTVLWFAPNLYAKTPTGLLYYSVEYGQALQPDFAYAIHGLFKDL